LLAATAAMAAAATASGQPNADAANTLNVSATETSFNSTGSGRGAVTTFTDDLFERGARVGSDHVSCVTTGPGSDLECYATDLLPNGQIQSIGTFDPTSQTSFTVSIVGGTGAYRDAQGVIEITLVSQTQSTYAYDIDT
jgi:hypothetical protein